MGGMGRLGRGGKRIGPPIKGKAKMKKTNTGEVSVLNFQCSLGFLLFSLLLVQGVTEHKSILTQLQVVNHVFQGSMS